MTRSRCWLFAAWLAVIAAGLLSRRYPWLLPAWMGKYPGDALWAIMAWLGCALVRPGAGVGRLAGVALAICWLDEASQLYHAPGIDALRATTAGHLVLGSAFSWQDMASYMVGIALAGAADLARARLHRHRHRHRRQ